MSKRTFVLTGLVAAAALALVAAACGGGPESETRLANGEVPVVSSGKLTQELYQALQSAKTDLGAKIGIESDRVYFVNSEGMEWPDASLGVPEPGQAYAQVSTAGFVFHLAADGKQYEYRADSTGSLVKFAGVGELPAGFDPDGIAF